MPTTDELRFLRSYLGGPRIWDASALQSLVHSLYQQKLIEPCTDPERKYAYQITRLGREALPERYAGMEPCTSAGQVVRYLTQNYADAEGVPMPERVALDIAGQGEEAIRKGIEIFRSNVEYLGDEALVNSGIPGWLYIPEPDEEDA